MYFEAAVVSVGDTEDMIQEIKFMDDGKIEKLVPIAEVSASAPASEASAVAPVAEVQTRRAPPEQVLDGAGETIQVVVVAAGSTEASPPVESAAWWRLEIAKMEQKISTPGTVCLTRRSPNDLPPPVPKKAAR